MFTKNPIKNKSVIFVFIFIVIFIFLIFYIHGKQNKNQLAIKSMVNDYYSKEVSSIRNEIISLEKSLTVFSLLPEESYLEKPTAKKQDGNLYDYGTHKNKTDAIEKDSEILKKIELKKEELGSQYSVYSSEGFLKISKDENYIKLKKQDDDFYIYKKIILSMLVFLLICLLVLFYFCLNNKSKLWAKRWLASSVFWVLFIVFYEKIDSGSNWGEYGDRQMTMFFSFPVLFLISILLYAWSEKAQK